MSQQSVESKYLSRKFILACSALALASGGLFFDAMGGGEYVAALTVILGSYKLANVQEGKK